MTHSASLADKAIEQILELSADLQIKRRTSAKWSLAFYDLSVAIAAYGDALEVLTTLQREEEERSVSLDLLGSLECPPSRTRSCRHTLPLAGADLRGTVN
jgi:hypothetical protein